MARKKERVGWRERLSVALDIPSDIFPGSTCVDIRGRESVTIHGGRAIECYTDCEIRIACSDGVVAVHGMRLCCRAFRRGLVTVTGRIESVHLEERK